MTYALKMTCLFTCRSGAQPEVDRARSYPLIKEALAQHAHCRVVIKGFYGSELAKVKRYCSVVTVRITQQL